MTIRQCKRASEVVTGPLMSSAAVAKNKSHLLTRDYNHATDGEYHKLRNLAEQAYNRRQKLSHESQAAYKHGQKGKAHQLSEQAKQQLIEAENYNLQAAEYVFVRNNADSASDEVDLHGLYVKEAKWVLKKRISTAIQQGEPYLKVIVGKGLHSVHGVAKIKPAVEELCDEAQLRNHLDPKNAGVLIIELQGSQVPQSWDSPEMNGHPSANMNMPQQAYTTGPVYQQVQQPQYYPQQQQQLQQQQGNDGSLLAQIFSILCVCTSKIM